MEASRLEDDKFRNKMLSDDHMGMVFMSGVGNERARIFNKLRSMDLGNVDTETIIRKLIKDE
jgi:hypothetical protein